jgi:hypothetical protein
MEELEQREEDLTIRIQIYSRPTNSMYNQKDKKSWDITSLKRARE